jgi:hypothetical protein
VADKAPDSRGTALRSGVEMGRERAQRTRGSSRQLGNNIFASGTLRRLWIGWELSADHGAHTRR